MRAFRLFAFFFLLTPFLYADADRTDWTGQFAMDHDGHLGTLRINPSRRKCRNLPCPGLDLQYVDDHGTILDGSVDLLDENGQHMTFTIEFPGNPQVFSVYIFSFDKTKLAGTTVWGGRTFGVMATKSGGVAEAVTTTVERPVSMRADEMVVKQAVTNPKLTTSVISADTPKGIPAGTPTRVIASDGSIELHYPDGTVRSKRIGDCGWSTRYPNGKKVNAFCAYEQVFPLVPPPAPRAGSAEDRWLNGQDTESLNILKGLLGGANSSDYQNYINNYEKPPDPLVFKRIYFRMQSIAELTSVPQ